MKREIYIFILFFAFPAFAFLNKEANQKNFRLIVFEGSDWCPNCRRFERNILSDTSFIDFLNKNIIDLQRIDFPQRKKQSEEEATYCKEMAEKYSFEGIFPTIVFSRADTFYYRKIVYRNQSVDEMKEVIIQKMSQMK